MLEENPSLKPDLEAALNNAYAKGMVLAVRETDLPSRTFPSECLYNLAEILDKRCCLGEPGELINE